jgi:copper homeostasis protein CutC
MLQRMQEVNVERNLGLIIMPGSGINARTAVDLIKRVRQVWIIKELHMSGGGFVAGNTLVDGRRGGMNMGAPGDNEWNIWKTDETRVRETWESINNSLDDENEHKLKEHR